MPLCCTRSVNWKSWITAEDCASRFSSVARSCIHAGTVADADEADAAAVLSGVLAGVTMPPSRVESGFAGSYNPSVSVPQTTRVHTVDVTRGVAMILMAIDHV